MRVVQSVGRRVIDVVRLLPPAVGAPVLRACTEVVKLCAGKTHVATAYFGADFACNLDDLIQRYIFYFGMWEPMISHVTQQLLRPGDVYVDVGANIGYDSLLASHCVGEGGKVVSIEASPGIFSLLADNVARNSAGNIRLVHAAVSDRGGTLPIYAGRHKNIGQTTTIAARGLAYAGVVNALPLDEILSPEERARVRLIKIDIEGGELPVLNRFIDTLSNYPDEVALLVEASVQSDPQEWSRIFSRFREAGFRAYGVENSYDVRWYLRYRRATPVVLLDTVPDRQSDILWIRQELPPSLDTDTRGEPSAH